MRLKRTVLLICLLGEAVNGAFMADTALIEDIGAITDIPGKIKVLFGQQDGNPFGLEPLNRLGQLFDNDRRQPVKEASPKGRPTTAASCSAARWLALEK
jgi:hypothetical protein